MYIENSPYAFQWRRAPPLAPNRFETFKDVQILDHFGQLFNLNEVYIHQGFIIRGPQELFQALNIFLL